MSEPDNKRKKPNYFQQNYKKRKFVLESGQTGFLCTCNFREKECVREAYNLLNSYADALKCEQSIEEEANICPDAEISTIPKEQTEEPSDDIAEEISKEISALKSVTHTEKRFQVVDSGAKNILFIKTTLENPNAITTAIINDILQSKQQKSRFLLRLLPIEITCKANKDDINKSMVALIEKYFCGDPKTFAVCFNRRFNNKLNRSDVIDDIATSITDKNPNHKVDLKNAELTILVEIIRGICLLSVIPDYIKFKKYNLLELFESLSKNTETETNISTSDDVDSNNLLNFI